MYQNPERIFSNILSAKDSGLTELQHSLRSYLIFVCREAIGDQSQKQWQLRFCLYPVEWPRI